MPSLARKQCEELLYNEIESYRCDPKSRDSDRKHLTNPLAPHIMEAYDKGAEENEILLALRRLKVKTPNINYSAAADRLLILNEKRSGFLPPDPAFSEEFMEKVISLLNEPANTNKSTPTLADKAFLQASIMGLYQVETEKGPLRMLARMTAARKTIDLVAAFNETTPEDLLGFDPDEYIIPHGYEW